MFSRFERCYPWFLLAVVVFGSWWWNGDFGEATNPAVIATMNDVPDILRGFENTPNFWRDGLRWWHGPWIQEGIHVYRPLSSMMLWWECFVGQKYGFEWVARFGIVLLCVLSWQCVLLAREFTRSRGAMLVAAVVAPTARFWLMGGSAPFDWMAWMAGHHDLLMTAFLLGALLWWTRWIEFGKRRDLVGSLLLFVLGVLSKEFLYIYPAMALSVVLFHPRRRVELRQALGVVGGMFVFLAVMWVFRSMVLPHPYNPPRLKVVHFIRRPFLYWFPAFYRYIPATEWFPAILAAWLFVSVGLGLRYRDAMPGFVRRVVWPFGVLFGAMGFALCFDGVGVAFWYFAEVPGGLSHTDDLIQMVFTLWALSAVWKYRRQEPTLAVFGVFLLAYIPVWTYLGWHYTLAGWFVRAGLWWPMLYHLARLDFLKRPRLRKAPLKVETVVAKPVSSV